MDKNILIIGPARAGKTTLSRKLNEQLKYSIVNLDNIISALELAYPELEIKHDALDVVVASNFASFIINYLKELSEGNFYYENKFVIEGTHIDFEKLIPNIDKEKYMIIGLTYNNITNEELFRNIKDNDTEDDWTYYLSDEELKGNVDYFIERNNFFDEQFKKYDIKTYDVSTDRKKIFDVIIKDILNK